MSKQIAVFGGNGFLGKRFCESAVKQGLKVVSISRSGTAPDATTGSDLAWIKSVEWHKGDIFTPASYREILKQSAIVVHSVGILLEHVNYKKAWTAPLQVFNSSPENSYEKVNYLSAVELARAFRETSELESQKFVYVSADKPKIPVIPSGYIDSKRNAEYELLQISDKHPSFSSLILRPGIMFDAEDPGSSRTMFTKAISCLNAVPGSSFVSRPVISTQKVAQVASEKWDLPGDKILSLEALLK